jgi:tRNA pseudouridine32 synthase/23S rRNA pseudouridine746 synthase
MNTPILNNPKPDDFVAPICHEAIEILYQDDAILVINKPSGLLSLSGKNPLNKDSVHSRLVQEFPTALMVHRLDLGTSGLMLIALSKDIVKNLNQQFSNRSVKKTYQAILDGKSNYLKLKNHKGVIDLPIAKGVFPYQKICHETGKAALSEYRVIKQYEDSFRVEFTPMTGRTHQLRVHSAAIGHAILGCDLYGTKRSQEKSSRLLLHATGLQFTHPVSNVAMGLESLTPF